MPAGVDLLAVGDLAPNDRQADRAEPGRIGDRRDTAHLPVAGDDRRGRDRHEYWPSGDPPTDVAAVEPDLEDIVIALSLAREHTTGVGP